MDHALAATSSEVELVEADPERKAKGYQAKLECKVKIEEECKDSQEANYQKWIVNLNAQSFLISKYRRELVNQFLS